MHYFSKFQDPILKNRKKTQKNSIMKIDFQTSVKSDKKSAFAYIMEGTKRCNRNMYVGTLCRGIFGEIFTNFQRT